MNKITKKKKKKSKKRKKKSHALKRLKNRNKVLTIKIKLTKHK